MNMNDEQIVESKNDESQESPKTSAADPIETFKKEAADYKDGWQRALSDYQNLQKEVARQRSEWATMSELQILEEFLPVYSNFKKAFASGTIHDTWNTTQAGWVKGIEYIMKQFADVLRNHGIEEMKTVGELFDASKHEIVGEELSEEPEHVILREIDTGYTMKGKVIKVAKVVVAKHDTRDT